MTSPEIRLMKKTNVDRASRKTHVAAPHVGDIVAASSRHSSRDLRLLPVASS